MVVAPYGSLVSLLQHCILASLLEVGMNLMWNACSLHQSPQKSKRSEMKWSWPRRQQINTIFGLSFNFYSRFASDTERVSSEVVRFLESRVRKSQSSDSFVEVQACCCVVCSSQLSLYRMKIKYCVKWNIHVVRSPARTMVNYPTLVVVYTSTTCLKIYLVLELDMIVPQTTAWNRVVQVTLPYYIMSSNRNDWFDLIGNYLQVTIWRFS